jgi:hypothetical protein
LQSLNLDTVSSKQDYKLLKTLQSQYPAYFGNLSKRANNVPLSGVQLKTLQALINKGIAEKLTKDAVNLL